MAKVVFRGGEGGGVTFKEAEKKNDMRLVIKAAFPLVDVFTEWTFFSANTLYYTIIPIT